MAALMRIPKSDCIPLSRSGSTTSKDIATMGWFKQVYMQPKKCKLPALKGKLSVLQRH